MVLEEFLSEWRNSSDRVLVHTSGSTGAPKPMWAEKEKMRNSARITCDFLGLQPGDTALLCMNLKYIGAKMVVVRSIERRLRLLSVEPSGHPMAALLQGQGVTETDFHDPTALPHPCPQGKEIPAPAFAAMVPLQVYNTLQVPEEAALLRQTRHLIIGGGAGPEASEWYQPFPSVKVSLNQDDCLMINAPLVHEGILETNDRAEIVPGKGFRILGRKDNVIVSGGIKIQIEEVEHALKPHLSAPFIIARRKDVKFGEAEILLTEASDTEAVAAICRRVLPKYWIPREVRHIDHIPMTETGKPKRGGETK